MENVHSGFLLFLLIDRYLKGLLDPIVTLLEVHKLMYFMQEAQQPLRLKYVKGHYGPYAENLGHVLKTIEGHLVSGYADSGDDPAKQLELVPGAARPCKHLLFLRNSNSGQYQSRGELRG